MSNTIFFHKKQRADKYVTNPFRQENLYYNKEKDYYVCPMGQHMEWTGVRHSRTESGYVTESVAYIAARCEGCPLRCICFSSKSQRRTIEVNHRLKEYKQKAREKLTSEKGIKHRGKRCIEPEAVFGQIKYDMECNRFRHFGKDKFTMDFAFFAIAFNVKKMYAKIKNEKMIDKNYQNVRVA